MKRRPVPHREGERGIVLVAALVLLVGLSALALAAGLTAVLEKTSTVAHRSGKRALYAADSGVEAARQQITTFAQGKLDSLVGIWAGNGVIIAEPDSVFPPDGLVIQLNADPVFTATTMVVFEDSTLELQSQVYNYRYRTRATGTFADGRKIVEASGRLRVSATRGSFADYLIFTDTHAVPGGSPIWFHTTGHFDGRVHTNDEYRFAYFPTFEDLVTSVNGKAWYYNNARNKELDADRNGDIDVPNFYGGFQRAAPQIDLPDNSFSQERAALGGNPGDTSPVTNSEIRSFLGLPAGSTAPPSGVYVPNSGGAVTGGIYISGNANEVALSVTGSTQVMAVTDASGHTSTIHVDHEAGTTTVYPYGGGSTTYSGLPRGVMYVKGKISKIGGPSRSGSTILPAIARDQQLSIVSTGDIVVQKDLAYEDFDGGQNVLGLFSSGGSVRVGTSAPDELVMDAYVLASAYEKVFTVDDYAYGGYRGQVHLRGGMVTNYYGAFGTFNGTTLTGYGRDFRYDRRGFVPPYYPLTQRYVPDQPEPRVLAWREVFD